MNLEKLTEKIEMSMQITNCKHLIIAIMELMHADKTISPKALDSDASTVYEILRKHDTAAGLLFMLKDIVEELDAMT